MIGPGRIIIPFAIGIWLLSFVLLDKHTPDWIQGLFIFALALAIPYVVLICFAETGWKTLARQYLARVPFAGTWTLCRTFQMAPVSIDDPDYDRLKARFIGTLRVGIADDAMFVSTIFSNIPILRRVFPALRIPWEAVSSASFFEAPGWVRAGTGSGALVQATYDPGFKGRFLELKVGEPPVFLQMPAALLGDKIGRLPLEADA